MAATLSHYDTHLGPLYAWMVGDIDAAMARCVDELDGLALRPIGTGRAVDLGAGLGLHSIALARRGFSVLAVENSRPMLVELNDRTHGLPVQVSTSDLLDFRRQLTGEVDVVLCMGDTITHLPDMASVEQLVAEVAASLALGGAFVATFRDYASRTLQGEDRFIPVRSDDRRIHTCFLEYRDRTVIVHDMFHERHGAEWKMRVSGYEKLRLPSAELLHMLGAQGLRAHLEAGAMGMARIVARRVSS